MAQPKAELSSISSTLEELIGRIGKLADHLSRSGQDNLAGELFEIERSLVSGSRRLTRIVDDKDVRE